MKTNLTRIATPLLLLSALALVGCGGSSTSSGLIQDEIDRRDAQINELENALEQQENLAHRSASELENTRARAEQAERELEQLHADMDNMSTSSTQAVSASGDLLPPSAKPGECYARVVVEPVYETRTESILVKEASERIEIIPAKFEWAEERVLVKEASTRIETVPATFEWVEETVLVKPATTVMKDVPPVYETVEERILVTPARTYWKKGRGLIERVDNNTGEIMCLVEEPAVYRTVSKRVLKTPASTVETPVDAVYETVRRQAVKTPATTRTVDIPAEYETVKVRRMVEPAREKRIPVPAEYADVTKRTMVSPSHMEWRRVLCETNMSREIVSDIQRALQDKGHNPGPIDGIFGSQTKSAVKSFQTAQNMPVGGLTYETLRALGVKK